MGVVRGRGVRLGAEVGRKTRRGVIIVTIIFVTVTAIGIASRRGGG